MSEAEQRVREDGVVLDARQQKVRCFWPGPGELLEQELPGGLTKEQFARIRLRAIGPDAAHGQMKGLVLLIAVVAGLWVIVELMDAADGMRTWRRVIFSGVGALGALVWAILWWRGFGDGWAITTERKQRIVRAMLAAGRCASCAYDLTGAPAQRDGCIVCPECSAAWRVADVGSDHSR